MGIGLQQLADLIGMTYNQVHKYEAGISRIAAARLYSIAVALSTSVAFFFEHIAPDPLGANQHDDLRRLVELKSHLLRIADPKDQRAVCLLAETMAGSAGGDAGQI